MSLSLVLHTHMPYVEGYGTWPFGEEWLWEAIATSYLPLLDVLDDHPGVVTLSLTPVLCDQLAAPGALERCARFLRELRPESHRRDLAAARDPALVAALEHSAECYAAAARALARRRDLVAAFAPHAAWTAPATHPVLPLLATDAGVRLQLRTGIAAHGARFGGWGGGLWLPECAHAPWLDRLLVEAGARIACVDWTDVLGSGPQAPRRTAAGMVLAPIDREAVELVWHARGYPSRGAYRDSHRLTAHHHRAWAVDGAAYDPDRASELARADAEDFVERVARRGDCVVAFDTELLGHWWHEGVQWLRAVLEGCARRGVELAPPGRGTAVDAPASLSVTTWGRGRDLRTWSGPAAARFAWGQRAAELEAFRPQSGAGPRALRELLALQASDWAFLASERTAGDYPRERFDGHRTAFAAALADPDAAPAVRRLAPWLAAP